MTQIWVVGGVLTAVLTALLCVLFALENRRAAATEEKKENPPNRWKEARSYAKKHQVWVGVLLCHSALAIFFPAIWLFLARVPVFWLAQVFLFIAFSVLRDETSKKLTGWGQVVCCVVVVAVVVELIGLSRGPFATRLLSLPPLNPPGSSLPNMVDENRRHTIRDFLDRNKSDNPDINQGLIRITQMRPEMIRPTTKVLVAPMEGWSEPLFAGRDDRLPENYCDGTLRAATDKGKIFSLNLGPPTRVGFPKWIKLQSATGKVAVCVYE
jgi:hypothetical protein